MGNGIDYLKVMFLLLMAAGASFPCLAGVHDGGVGACNHCHVMHANEVAVNGSSALLVADNSSELCLGCHAEALGAVFGMNPLAPPPERGPGNFVFLLEDNLNDAADGATNPISGDAAGHNLNAPGYGLSSDPTFVMSPGGNYSSADMSCTSCHDPHGNQNYRFLYGAGMQTASGMIFTYAAPVAEGLDLLVGAPESRSNHVAYRSGMSQWCGNCHQDYLTSRHSGTGGFRHSTDVPFKQGHVFRYNAYNGTLDPSGGNQASAYLPEVSFEDPLNAINFTAGPTTGSRVTCLSCHRAHASSGPRSGRWDFNVDALGQDGVVSGSYVLPNPYPDPGQERLCLKCHKTVPGPGLGSLELQN